jgi:hypothetical protein
MVDRGSEVYLGGRARQAREQAGRHMNKGEVGEGPIKRASRPATI